MTANKFQILTAAIFSGLLIQGQASQALMSADSGCLWTVTTTTWSDGSQTVETQLSCKGGGGGGGDPYATNFGGGIWEMPSTSIYDGLVNEPIGGGRGRQVASNGDDVVQAIIDESKTELCVELTSAEVAADASGKDFAVLRQECSSPDQEISEGWGIATQDEIAEYKRNVGAIPKSNGARCLRTVVSLNDPMKSAKLPGKCPK